MPVTFIGSTNIILDGMGLCRYDEHVKAWKWRKFCKDVYGIVLLMDSNRPSSFNIKDNATNKIVANVATHEQATEYCFEKELKPSLNNNTCWRYTIEPVRELEYKNTELNGF